MKIFVSTFPFGRLDEAPIRLLEQSGHAFTLNPLNRKLQASDLVELATEYDGLIAGTEDLRPLIEASSNLKYIARVGIGLDTVPLAYCRSLGIQVCYTPDAVTPAVAELTLGLFIDGLRFIKNADRALRRGQWTRPVGRRLNTTTIGLIGFGRVAKSLCRLLAPFDPPSVLVNDIRAISDELNAVAQETNLRISEATKEEIFARSDIVSIHTPLTSKTKSMVSANELNIMKIDALLVNVSRGGIIDETALGKNLTDHNLGPSYAALDVFESEPYAGPLVDLENITLTQHMASCSVDCRIAMESQATEDMIRMCSGLAPFRPVPDIELTNQEQ